jgi:outer membrane immunogenic protein
MNWRLGVALAALLAGPAMAADLKPVYKAPPPVTAVYNWTGWHVGASAGYGWGDEIRLSGDPVNIFDAFNTGAAPNIIASDPRGFVGGGNIGYDWQTSWLVLGVEADISYSAIRKNEDLVIQGLGVPRFLHGEQNLDWLATFRGRVGVSPADRWLAYVTGGLAVGHAEAAINFTTTVPNNIPACIAANIGVCVATSDAATKTGWTVGGGLQYALWTNWSVGVEYLYYDLGRVNLVAIDTRFAAPQPTLFGSADIKGNIVRGTLTYRFGGGSVARY